MGYTSQVAIRVTKDKFNEFQMIFESNKYFKPNKIYIGKESWNKDIITMFWNWVKWYGFREDDPVVQIERKLKEMRENDEPYDFITVGEDGNTEGTHYGLDDYEVGTEYCIYGLDTLEEVNMDLEPIFSEKLEYIKYKKEWLKTHVTSIELKKAYINYLGSEECSKGKSFTQYIETQGFNGSIYSSYEEWLNNEYKEQ